MVGERQIAARAFQGIAAVAAEDVGGRAAPVQEQDRLLSALHHLRQAALQLAAEDGAVALLELLAHIHGGDRGQFDCRHFFFQGMVVGGYPEPSGMRLDLLLVRQDARRQAQVAPAPLGCLVGLV